MTNKRSDYLQVEDCERSISDDVRERVGVSCSNLGKLRSS
jgi:hypothetical protein